MKYARTASLFFDTPLALLPAKIEEIRAFFDVKLRGGEVAWQESVEPFQATFYAMDDWYANGGQSAAASTKAERGRGGQIAVLPLHGVLAQRMNMMQAMSGGTSTEQFGAEFRALMNDPDVSAVVVDVDSPGGSVYGMLELADLIHGERGKKPMVAQVDSLAASAAYLIASQFDEIVATRGADLGHIGVAALHLDLSKKAEQEGVTPYLVTAGKYKHEQAMGSDLIPPTDEAIAHLQHQVDETYAQMVQTIARGRGVKAADVRNGYGEGRVVGAQEALKLGMADRIGTLEDTLTRLAKSTSSRQSRESAAHLGASLDVEDEPAPPDEVSASNEAAEREEGARRLALLRFRELQDRAALTGARGG